MRNRLPAWTPSKGGLFIAAILMFLLVGIPVLESRDVDAMIDNDTPRGGETMQAIHISPAADR
ncbi:MAG: hypothetical protein O2923_13225 [Verrucomicrobia bacterium]|nr:hypothetical protein [Verrucomicrobiota bacterium]MDA1087260.1 hypothetical protein [Verrucomicrobiota bacterium]